MQNQMLPECKTGMPLPQTDIVKEEGYYQPPNDSARWEPTCTVAGEFQR